MLLFFYQIEIRSNVPSAGDGCYMLPVVRNLVFEVYEFD